MTLNFDDWLEKNDERLQLKYVENNPEEFPTDESYCDIYRNVEFQKFTEEEYEKYLENENNN